MPKNYNIAILTTGGTIEKTYDETTGMMRNVGSVLHDIVLHLRLPTCDLKHIPVMAKDSLDMTKEDRDLILQYVRAALVDTDAVMVIHGTDTLAKTGDLLHEELKGLDKPVVLTGAMRPYEFRDTDAFQNITEALLACRFVAPGVYAVIHNQLLRFPGVVKDRSSMTFRHESEIDEA